MKSNWSPNKKPFEELEGLRSPGYYLIVRDSTQEFLQDIEAEIPKWSDSPMSAMQYESLDHALSDAKRVFTQLQETLVILEPHVDMDADEEATRLGTDVKFALRFRVDGQSR
jgi:hypothetical protein